MDGSEESGWGRTEEDRWGGGEGEGRKVVRGMWASRGYKKPALGQWLQQ